MASEAFVVCENLVKIYKLANLETVALQGLDLAVERGEMVGLVGASGGGKTTLMNVVGGLDRPSAGRVWVDGIDLLKLSDAALDRYRRTKVGFVWQEGSRNLVSYLNAIENVELPMTLAGQAGRAKRRRAEALLEAVGLAERRTHRLAELSGGEQQRVAIAVALTNNPVLLLADEPTGELDSTTALNIYGLFRQLRDEFGLTILIVSHDPGLARHVDRVVAIRDGKTATETVRQRAVTPLEDGSLASENGEHAEETFEELIVLDAAGRLQVPKAYLERFDIRDRVRLELSEEGILIRPVARAAQTPAAARPAESAPDVPRRGVRGFLDTWRRARRREDP